MIILKLPNYHISFSVLFLIKWCHEPETFAKCIHSSLCRFCDSVLSPRWILILIRWREMITEHFLMKCHAQSWRNWRDYPYPICWASTSDFVFLSKMSHELIRLKKSIIFLLTKVRIRFSIITNVWWSTMATPAELKLCSTAKLSSVLTLSFHRLLVIDVSYPKTIAIS